MQEVNPTIQEQVKAFHRRITASERLYREAIAALAGDQTRRRSKRVPEPPRRCLWLRVPCRVLIRGAQQLFSLAFRKRGRSLEMWPRSTSDTEPIIIDVEVIDVYPDPLHCRQTDAPPRDWLLIGNSNENKEYFR